MTKVLLLKTYKARKPGSILEIPERQAKSPETLGLGEIVKDEPEVKKPAKGGQAGAE